MNRPNDRSRPHPIHGTAVAPENAGRLPSPTADTTQKAPEHDAELVRLARFTALGDMLDDLVHEMNQPLAAIVNYARGCALRVAAGTLARAELEDVLGRIADHALGASGQLRRMKDLARDGSGELTLIDVNDVVRDVAAFARAYAGHAGCRIHVSLGERLPRVSVDRIKITQVVLCIVRSCIALGTRSRQPEVWLQTLRNGTAAVEVVAATCPPKFVPALLRAPQGSTDGTLPFGLQLELSRANAIAGEHGSRLDMSIVPTRGACFRFVLACDEEIAP